MLDNSTELIIMSLSIILILLFTMVSALFLTTYKKSRRTSYDSMKDRLEIENKIYKLQRELQETELRNRKIINEMIFEGQSKSVDKGEDFFRDQVNIEKDMVLYLSPFLNEKSFEIASEVVLKSVEKIGMNFVRSDEEYSENIMSHIVELIKKARIIIVNIDGRNPNVFYELGIAHAIGKDTILISSDKREIPFDIMDKRIIFYSSPKELEDKIVNNIGKLLT